MTEYKNIEEMKEEYIKYLKEKKQSFYKMFPHMETECHLESIFSKHCYYYANKNNPMWTIDGFGSCKV